MALAFHNYALAIIVLTMIPFESTNGFSSPKNNQPPKSLHFTVFQQETINKTLYITSKGVKGIGGQHFGNVFVYHENLTTAFNSSSEVVGVLEGTSVDTGLDGGQAMLVGKLTLNLKNHKGSINIVGVKHSSKSSDIPVVGGTEDFMFVQGYVKSSLVQFKDRSVVHKVEVHLFWPPYVNATNAS